MISNVSTAPERKTKAQSTELTSSQPAEPPAEYKDRPELQDAAGSKEDDAKPTNGISTDGAKALALRARGHLSVGQKR